MSVSASVRRRVEPIVLNLAKYRSTLIHASAESEGLAEGGETREFMRRLPPLAFEIARETKELVQRVEMTDQERVQGREDCP